MIHIEDGLLVTRPNGEARTPNRGTANGNQRLHCVAMLIEFSELWPGILGHCLGYSISLQLLRDGWVLA